METAKSYALPQLPYGYDQLQPAISKEQLTLHHQKHHQAYVNDANAILERLDKARKEGTDFDVKATLKELSFHIGGHLLHSLFWANLAPARQRRGKANRNSGLAQKPSKPAPPTPDEEWRPIEGTWQLLLAHEGESD